jgi:hypothetical protein
MARELRNNYEVSAHSPSAVLQAFSAVGFIALMLVGFTGHHYADGGVGFCVFGGEGIYEAHFMAIASELGRTGGESEQRE